jgi:hypothetical protein
MQVETYEIEEIKDELGIMAADSEAGELIEKLGLEGQKKLFNGETVTRMPYRAMTAEEEFVYSFLCPVKTTLEKFGTEAIPLRVLQVASHAKESGFFKQLYVWSPKLATVKDPVLVGIIPHPQGWVEQQIILARWARELDPLDKLIPLAKKMWAAQKKQALTKIKTEVDAGLREIDAMESVPDAIPENIGMPTFYSA